jgi:HEAT repeat protein
VGDETSRLARASVPLSTPVRSERTWVRVAFLATAIWFSCGRNEPLRPSSSNATDLAGTASPSSTLAEARPVRDPLVSAFASESDPEKRIDMVESVLSRDLSTDTELAVLVLATDSSQPRAVRVAAIDALSEIQDLRTATILQLLKADPDREVRKMAADALAEFEDLSEEGE